MRPLETEFGSFYKNYIDLVPEGNILDLMEVIHQETQSILAQIPEDKANYRYAPNKWSIKELLCHLIDNELIMSYRAMRFARKDTTELPGYEQDDYIAGLDRIEQDSLQDLIEDWRIMRMNSTRLFRRFSPEAMLRMGIASNNIVSVRALAYIIVGHELHHRSVLVERYLNLL